MIRRRDPREGSGSMQMSGGDVIAVLHHRQIAHPGRVLRNANRAPVTIFEDLRKSHEVQRSLARSMTHARASSANRRAAFLALANELDAHATAEERHFYVPLLMQDAGLRVSRHALADHHKAEDLVEQLRGVDPATDRFADLTLQLSKEVRDHLDEEEHGTFQLAGRLLSKSSPEATGCRLPRRVLQAWRSVQPLIRRIVTSGRRWECGPNTAARDRLR